MKIIIAIPAYNEEEILCQSINSLVDFCQHNLADDWQIVISDNNSSDQTKLLSTQLSAANPRRVGYLFVAQKGKGAAIKQVWQRYAADIYIFMDADLATDLSSLPLLVSKIKAGFDLVIGSRTLPESKVWGRSQLRRLFSWGYSWIARKLLKLKLKDLPCGFKAINQRTKDSVLNLVQSNDWFFDSELLVLADRAGLAIAEVPVIWKESKRPSKVPPIKLAFNYFNNVLKLRSRINR